MDSSLSSRSSLREEGVEYKQLKNPIGRSLIHNGSVQLETLSKWEILSSGGNGWRVESPPEGVDELPSEIVLRDGNYCFATSYGSCSKEQVVDLIKEGVPPELLDAGLLSITVEDWFAGRFDCGCIYELRVDLLDDTGIRVLDSFQSRQQIDQWKGRDWKKVSHTFTRLPMGLKFVKFYHGGRDTQGWFGHYGSKMAGAAVFVHLSSKRG